MFHVLLAIIYLAFIGLGLPDSLLGAAWPLMYPQFQVPVSYAGVISMIISAGTIVSSLQSDRMTKKLGTGRVTAISVGMTAVALFGFATSGSYWMLCLWAIPYGLGAGSVDASLNNYVALHYASQHMSWLHCMWGVGASLGPYVMGYALAGGGNWNSGYFSIAMIQIVLTFILFVTLPIWKKQPAALYKEAESQNEKPLTLAEVLRIRGVKEVIITFFCYCALEQTAGLWASSYLVLHAGLERELAAKLASFFYIGITAGRAVSGFVTMKVRDATMIRMGLTVIAVGILVMLLPFGSRTAAIGFIIVGIGCAPIYPSIIHQTPYLFGKNRSQAIIGVQMASAYVGTLIMPPFFGLIANHIQISLLPVYLMGLLIIMLFTSEKLKRVAPRHYPASS